MESKPAFDRSILIPAAISVLSLIGICLVLLIGSLTARSTEVQTPTETPFKYIFLGTEPGIFTPLLDDTQIALTENPETSTSETPVVLLTPTGSSVNFLTPSPISLPSRVFSLTPTRVMVSKVTITLTPTISPNFDDTDFRLIYTGNWIPQTNVPGAYQGTLHISNTLEDKVSFTFLGQQLSYFYQAGPSLGTVVISIDGLGSSIDQSQTTTQIKSWISGIIPNTTHTVDIRHDRGGSVNIDSIIILGNATATPTHTFTPTP